MVRGRQPRSDFHRQLSAELAGLWVLDSHEHLVDEADRAALARDCFYLTAHYLRDDLVSAGMPRDQVDALTDPAVPLGLRWERFAPFWEVSRTTGYGQAVEIAAREVFGVDGLTGSTYQVLSERVAASAGRPGWYEHVLKKQARFIGCILDGGRTAVNRRYFLPVLRFDAFIMAARQDEIEALGLQEVRSIGSLDDFLSALDQAFDRGLRGGMLGVKCGLAYRRTLAFENVPRHQAEPLFQRALQDALPRSEAKALQDFLFHEVCDRAGAHGLPVQVHTGLHAGNNNRIDHATPVHLINALQTHPQVKFDLFHGGYPYGGELAAIAKNFPNAYINACWLAIISPTVLRRQLDEWLDTVPHNKIQAFGGDYRMVELSFAHGVMAREAVADVLAGRVEAGYLAEHDAPIVARRLLAENGLALFKVPAEHVAAAIAPEAATAAG